MESKAYLLHALSPLHAGAGHAAAGAASERGGEPQRLHFRGGERPAAARWSRLPRRDCWWSHALRRR
jgi:hypothetical protein